MDNPQRYLECRNLHRWADHSNHVREVCYFIGGDTGPIKIGFSRLPGLRLETLQTASPVKLRVLATALGGAARERAYHFQFERQRLRGEWFFRSHSLLKEIRKLGIAGDDRPSALLALLQDAEGQRAALRTPA